MEKYSGTIFFDLDGTLADTSEDIYESLNKTLKKFQIDQVPFDVVVDFIGDGVRPLIKKILDYLKRTNEEEEIVGDFIRNYRMGISKKTYIYPKVIDLIFSLKNFGMKVILLTNKIESLTIKLLSELCILNIFDGIVSGDTFDVKKPSADLLDRIKSRYEINHPIFVLGDGLNDLLFAENTGAIFLLSKWGFPTKKAEEYIKQNQIKNKIYITSYPNEVIQIVENMLEKDKSPYSR